jgi:hypothetical protein
MQDTSPAAKKPRDKPIQGRVANGTTRAERTWFEDAGDQPVDEPVIALILLPDEP